MLEYLKESWRCQNTNINKYKTFSQSVKRAAEKDMFSPSKCSDLFFTLNDFHGMKERKKWKERSRLGNNNNLILEIERKVCKEIHEGINVHIQ